MNDAPTPLQRSDLTRPALLRRLDQLDAAPSTGALTCYLLPGATVTPEPLPYPAVALLDAADTTPNGVVLFYGDAAAMAVVPPFPVERALMARGWETGPLREILNRQRTLGVILVRYGGYSIGVYRDGEFQETKTGGRFVKNRHRKGGQSQRRFDRIREKQVREHFDELGEAVQTRLLPVAAELDHVLLGGDRMTAQGWLKRAPLPPPLASKLLERFLPTQEPRREILLATPQQIWSSRVIEFEREEM